MNPFRAWMLRTLFPEVECFKHVTRIVDVQHTRLPSSPFRSPDGDQTVDSTVVLWRCDRCHRTETSTMLGKWTVDQLNGKPAVQSAIDELVAKSVTPS